MLEVIKNLVWSPVTAINLLLLGIVLLFKTRFNTVWGLPSVLRDTVLSVRKNRKAFGLMCTSLGGTIGVGNAIGVAGAIAEGGPGAVFWMAIAGLLGMVIKYAEVYLSVRYNGPIQYIEYGIGSKHTAIIFSVLCICVSFGMGNMSQVKAAVCAIDSSVVLKKSVISFVMSIAFLWVVKGGIEKIRKFSEVAVPFISVLYIVSLTLIILWRKDFITNVVSDILNGSGIITGFKWAILKRGITSGFSKAIFSSEAGLGSAGFAHSESDISAAKQARWAIVEVFIDSVICIMTATALLTFSKELDGLTLNTVTKGMFYLCFGRLGEVFYGVSMIIFAFSSLICWYYNGSQSVKYLCSKKKISVCYCLIFALLIFLSGAIGDSIIIEFSDIANGIMLTVNLCALWVLVFKNKLTF